MWFAKLLSQLGGNSHPKGSHGCIRRSSHGLSFLERVTLHLTVPAELKGSGQVSRCTDHLRAWERSELGSQGD